MTTNTTVIPMLSDKQHQINFVEEVEWHYVGDINDPLIAGEDRPHKQLAENGVVYGVRIEWPGSVAYSAYHLDQLEHLTPSTDIHSVPPELDKYVQGSEFSSSVDWWHHIHMAVYCASMHEQVSMEEISSHLYVYKISRIEGNPCPYLSLVYHGTEESRDVKCNKYRFYYPYPAMCKNCACYSP